MRRGPKNKGVFLEKGDVLVIEVRPLKGDAHLLDLLLTVKGAMSMKCSLHEQELFTRVVS